MLQRRPFDWLEIVGAELLVRSTSWLHGCGWGRGQWLLGQHAPQQGQGPLSGGKLSPTNSKPEFVNRTRLNLPLAMSMLPSPLTPFPINLIQKPCDSFATALPDHAHSSYHTRTITTTNNPAIHNGCASFATQAHHSRQGGREIHEIICDFRNRGLSSPSFQGCDIRDQAKGNSCHCFH